jgi:peptide/nickel transport system permease protein
MLTFTIRRLILAIPTLLFISLVIFLLLELPRAIRWRRCR